MMLELQVAVECWGSVLLRLEAMVLLEAVVSVLAENRRPPRTQATAVMGQGCRSELHSLAYRRTEEH